MVVKRVRSGKRRLGRHGSSSVCVPELSCLRCRPSPICSELSCGVQRFGLVSELEKHKYLAPRECAVRVHSVRAVHRHELVSAALSLARTRSKLSGFRVCRFGFYEKNSPPGRLVRVWSPSEV